MTTYRDRTLGRVKRIVLEALAGWGAGLPVRLHATGVARHNVRVPSPSETRVLLVAKHGAREE